VSDQWFEAKQKQDIMSVLSSKTDQQKIEKAEKTQKMTAIFNNLEATMNNVFGCLPQWVGQTECQNHFTLPVLPSRYKTIQYLVNT